MKIKQTNSSSKLHNARKKKEDKTLASSTVLVWVKFKNLQCFHLPDDADFHIVFSGRETRVFFTKMGGKVKEKRKEMEKTRETHFQSRTANATNTHTHIQGVSKNVYSA